MSMMYELVRRQDKVTTKGSASVEKQELLCQIIGDLGLEKLLPNASFLESKGRQNQTRRYRQPGR